MRKTLSRVLAAALVCVGLAAPIQAQTITGISPVFRDGTITTTTCTTNLTQSGCVVATLGGYGSFSVQVKDNTAPNFTLQFEVSNDGVNFAAIKLSPAASSTTVSSATATGFWTGGTVAKFFRVRASAYVAGAPLVTIRASIGGSGGGGGGGGAAGAVTASDGDLATIGANADAAVGDATGTVNAHLRQIAKLLNAALTVNIAAAQTLATVTTVGTVTTITNNVPTNIVQIGGATQSATNPLFVRFTDGSTAIAPSTQLQENVASTLANITGGASFCIGVSAEQTVVTNGRPAIPTCDLTGKAIVLPYANPENFVSGVISSAMTGTTSTSLVASPGGSLRNYITSCTASNSHATVGTDIILQDGSGGTTIWVLPTAAVFGGAQITWPTPLRQPTTATALYAANVTTGSNTKIACSGYKGL